MFIFQSEVCFVLIKQAFSVKKSEKQKLDTTTLKNRLLLVFFTRGLLTTFDFTQLSQNKEP